MKLEITTALIALGGVVIGLVGRDVVMALLLARQRRSQEIKDKTETHARARHDIVRLYADPLCEATKSLGFRLTEIIDRGPARYLLSDAPNSKFSEYKRISTIYRLAALLGWIRAFRRERSYLDPEDIVLVDRDVDPITIIESALADGQHVEAQRLDELLNLWKVPKDKLADIGMQSRLAAEIDGTREGFLSEKNSFSASKLSKEDKIDLSRRCAELVSKSANVEIPTDLVDACAEQASVFFGIKEAYIYRDWQAALGDLLILETTGGPRRFDVIGFGEFENQYIKAHTSWSSEKRWFDRLEALFHDLDMTKTGIFDARRQQLRNLQEGCKNLEEYLVLKISDLTSVSANK